MEKSSKQTILAEDWDEEEWKENQEEGQILTKLNMKYDMLYLRKKIGKINRFIVQSSSDTLERNSSS